MPPPFPYVVSNAVKASLSMFQLVASYLNGQKATTWLQKLLSRGAMTVAVDLIFYYSWLSIEFMPWQVHCINIHITTIMVMAMVAIIDYRLIHTFYEILTVTNIYELSGKDLHLRISCSISIVSMAAILIEIPFALTSDSAIWMAIGRITTGLWAFTQGTLSIHLVRIIATALRLHREKQREDFTNICRVKMEEDRKVKENQNEKNTAEESKTGKKVRLSLKQLNRVSRKRLISSFGYEDDELESKNSYNICRSSKSIELMSIPETVSSIASSQTAEAQQQGEDEKPVSIARSKESVDSIPERKMSLISFSPLILHLRSLSLVIITVAYTFGPTLVIFGVVSILNGHHNVSYSEVFRKKQEHYNVLTDLISASALAGNQCLIFYSSRVELK
mmetsp:Transcript_16233/g.22673  ORF Transcript_16233/g.22673 Transcript_16233/m.22673 type:complete len:391 (+) Transcript_16233:126-1298(+)